MLDIKYTEFLNEEMGAISVMKLRDAMHDIIVALGPKDIMDVEEMAAQLQSEYKITISPFFLDKFLDDFLKVKRGDKKAKTFFNRGDMRWLGVRDVNGTKQMRNNLLHLSPNLAKHKRNLFKEEDKKKLDDAYKAGMPDLNFKEDVIKQSLILQKPSDSEEMMKIIYTDVIINKKYENTYDNCWKLMMLIAKNNKFDTIRGYFKLAPQAVRDEYYNPPIGQPKKINYELTRPPKEAKKKETKKPVSNPIKKQEISPKTTLNVEVVDKHLEKYNRWDEFISDTNFRKLIELIDALKSETHQDNSFDEFLDKTEQLKFILIKFYGVNTKDVILFFKNMGMAGFLREWQSTKKRPKINDF
jgi:hypothetical protein